MASHEGRTHGETTGSRATRLPPQGLQSQQSREGDSGGLEEEEAGGQHISTKRVSVGCQQLTVTTTTVKRHKDSLSYYQEGAENETTTPGVWGGLEGGVRNSATNKFISIGSEQVTVSARTVLDQRQDPQSFATLIPDESVSASTNTDDNCATVEEGRNEQRSLQLDHDAETRPGAYAAPGQSVERQITGFISPCRTDQESAPSDCGVVSSPEEPLQDGEVVSRNEDDGHLFAVAAVDANEERRQIRDQVHSEHHQNAPVASVVKEKPWHKHRRFWIFFVLVIAIATIVTGVVVGTRKDGGTTTVQGTASPPTTSPAPTDAPTMSPAPTRTVSISPAPTAIFEVTIVIQLDAKKQETGWKFECDSFIIEEVPPGSYAFIGSNHFRVEYLAIVVGADECTLTIIDTGGDGIENGFFEVYYGSDSNSQDLRLVSGFINPTETTTEFMVQVPDGVAPPTPTSAPGPPPPIGVSQVCTVCADGAAVNPFASAKNWNNINCDALENFAALQNVTTCREIQDSAAYDCGCTNFCTTICPDGVSGPSEQAMDNVVLMRGEEEVTCGDLQHEIVGSGKNGFEKCLFANLVGEDVCGCQPTGKGCRLCQGDVIPPPGSANIEVIPGLKCGDISGMAYTLRASAPSGVFFEVCPSLLAIGVYCGCHLPSIGEGGQDFCRICGDNIEDLLPVPARIINSTTMDQTTTCFHVEFVANLNSTTPEGCRAHQDDARERCCSL